MLILTYRPGDADALPCGRTLACAHDTIWLWPGIALTRKRGNRCVALSRSTLATLTARLHGPAVVSSGLLPAIERAADHLSNGNEAETDKILRQAAMPVSPDGALLMRQVAALLGIEPPQVPTSSSPRLWRDELIATFSRHHAESVVAAGSLAKFFNPEAARMAKAGFRADEARNRLGRWATDGGDANAGPQTGNDNTADSHTALWDALAHDAPLGLRHASPSAGLLTGNWDVAPHSGADSLFHTVQAEVGNEADPNGRDRDNLFEFLDYPRAFRTLLFRDLWDQLKRIEPNNPRLFTLQPVPYSPTRADLDTFQHELIDAQARAKLPPNPNWTLGWSSRGYKFEVERVPKGFKLPDNFKTIDANPYDVAVSVKSIDLEAPSYQNPAKLSRRIDGYVDTLARFQGAKQGEQVITLDQITGRFLDVVVPMGSITPERWETLERSIEHARKSGIYIVFIPY